MRIQPRYAWLLLPPALGLIVFLGPLQSMGTQEPTENPSAGTASAAPQLPGLWQVGSSLLGVLFLGAAGIMIMARLRGNTRSTESQLALRQTLRLSGRHRLHVVEFDGRVLLLGACDNNLNVLSGLPEPDALEDEIRIVERDKDEEEEEEDNGVVLRDMVIPRPASPRPGSGPRNLPDFKALLKRARSRARV